jgi:hypothetical protein
VDLDRRCACSCFSAHRRADLPVVTAIAAPARGSLRASRRTQSVGMRCLPPPIRRTQLLRGCPWWRRLRRDNVWRRR